ncbi:MAG: ParB/RepB/Spo0J family partition protein [Gammaproteobacteria bacterium]|nr:ParB/RepB/Spo0J family partition protein [Gammaproteobacteria bacterium]
MVKKRGLGKSLDALLVGSISHSNDSVDQPIENAKEKLCYLPLDLIQTGKYQPRTDINQDALEELALSIRSQGVIQPIIVRHLLGGRYEIVAGERRWRAARLAELKEIPAVVREIPDEAAIAIALIENIQREQLNPIEEACALLRLLDEFSMTHGQVAEAVGKSRTTVTNLLRLLSLADEVKKMLEHGDLEMGHARALLSLTPDLQVDAAETIVNKGLSVRETEDLVKRLQLPTLPNMPKTIDPDVRRLQEDLTARLKLGVSIKHNAKGKGKMVIQYKSLADLDKLLAFFA